MLEHRPVEFRSYLQDELIRRCKKNPGYSLRAFARYLELDHSTLSRILNGNRDASPTMMSNISKKLGLTEKDLNGLLRPTLKITRAKSRTYKKIADDDFASISSWYHYAILELTLIDSFSSDPRWIARKLDITPSEAKIAVERLVALGLLTKDKTGKLRQSASYTNIHSDMSAAAKRSMQREILEKALTALDRVPLSKRNQTSLTIAVDSNKLEELKELITDFRRSVAKVLSEAPKKDQVFMFSFSLFPVTQFDEANQ